MWPLAAAGGGVGMLALPDGYLLGWWLAGGVALLGVASVGIGTLVRFARLGLWLLLGYCYGHWQMGMALAERLPLCTDEVVRHFELTIADPPVLTRMSDLQNRWVARFRADITVPAADACLPEGNHRVRLSWYDPPALNKGERWAAEGRLRPPWGNRNPGGFDYESWLLGQGLAGTGYVRDARLLQPPPSSSGFRSRIREALRSWLTRRQTDHTGIILALMTGDDTALSQTEWRLLRDSGTVHLLVVSGLHVGMVSGLLFLLGRLLGRLSKPAMLWVGARRLAGAFALSGSGAYVWLSGMGVPALRAWMMSALVLLLLCSGRTVRGLNVVLLVMALVLLGNPLVVHQQGFWLSFAAVVSLVAWFEPALTRNPAEQASLVSRTGTTLAVFVQVQLVLLLALSPLLAAFQGGVPLHSPLVNALVVPLVALLVLPSVLISALLYFPFPTLADSLLTVAEISLDLVMFTITAAARVPVTTVSLDGAAAWILMLAVLLMLHQRPSWRLSVITVGLWWALLLPDMHRPLVNEFRVTALDVGQGSAILVDTNRHRLMFDAGPRFASGFDLGDSVVVPSFRQLGTGKLDALVISHADVDHAGGAGAVIEQLRPTHVYSSFPLPAAVNGRRSCSPDDRWQWDGVTFRFLHPEADWQGSDNDRSCVLLISNGRRSVLLAGDISRRVERRLAKQPVDLLMAPHHGSRTSSSLNFVNGFRPATVFVSTDRRSRYGHPHPEVIARYQGAEIWITGRSGALSWDSAAPGRVRAQREAAGAYWHRRAAPVRP